MKRGLIFWFTGLSGTGKTTLSESVRKRLDGEGLQTSILDGDDVRNRLHRHLGFSEAEIKEHNDLIVGLCVSERRRSDIVLVPIISPYRLSRANARAQLSPGFFEIHLWAGITVLEKRDPKGLYAEARSGEINNLIGYSLGAPYEQPEEPDLTIDTGGCHTNVAVKKLYSFIKGKISIN